MNKNESIINFAGMNFEASRRARLPKAKQWKVRRQAKNRLGVARNIRGVLSNLLGA